MKSLFVCTKPLQYLVSKIIIKHNCIYSNSSLLIGGFFYDAKNFTKNLKENDLNWLNIYFVKYKFTLYLKMLIYSRSYDTIFVDSDYGTINIILLILKLFKKNIYVIEEGIGVYSNDLLISHDMELGFSYFLKKKYFQFIGSGLFFGGSKWSNGIFVFSKIDYLNAQYGYNKEIFQIEESLPNYIRNNMDLLEAIFALDFINLKELYEYDKIIIYAVGANFLNQFKNYVFDKNFHFIKFHPSDKRKHINIFSDKPNVIYLESNVNIEIIVIYLKNIGLTVELFHENSSSALYLREEIELHNLSK